MKHNTQILDPIPWFSKRMNREIDDNNRLKAYRHRLTGKIQIWRKNPKTLKNVFIKQGGPNAEIFLQLLIPWLRMADRHARRLDRAKDFSDRLDADNERSKERCNRQSLSHFKYLAKEMRPAAAKIEFSQEIGRASCRERV